MKALQHAGNSRRKAGNTPAMRRFAVLLPVILAILLSLSCGGGAFFVSTDGHDDSFLSTSGTVSIVQLTFIDNRQVTIVTLLNNNAAQTFHFCGDMVDRFPMNALVTIRFIDTPGCSTAKQVIVL